MGLRCRSRNPNPRVITDITDIRYPVNLCKPRFRKYPFTLGFGFSVCIGYRCYILFIRIFFYQLTLSRSLISQVSLTTKFIAWTHSLFYLHFNSCYLKRLISQSKCSGPENFTLKYQQLKYPELKYKEKSDCVQNIILFQRVP